MTQELFNHISESPDSFKGMWTTYNRQNKIERGYILGTDDKKEYIYVKSQLRYVYAIHFSQVELKTNN